MVLSTWLQEDPATFLHRHWRKAPIACPGTAHETASRCRWATFHAILGQRPDALVADRGAEAAGPAPHDAASLQACFARGHGVVVRRAERHDPGLGELAAELERELSGEVNIQLFATPTGQRSFGWHFDAEDVFIVQSEGGKEYFFRENTVCPEARHQPRPDFARIQGERSDVLAALLTVGDCLYLPSPWWHIAEAREPSLHLSIGVLPKPARARFRKFR